MFFKQILIGFMILGVLGYLFGDHVFYYQGNLMMRWQYPMPAYEAYERIIRYYPDSKYIKEARLMMKSLRERSADLNKYLEMKEKEIKKIQAERQQKQSFH
jgi:outer membrane protein assembly factor BamD (BamD/ComL family)